MQWSLLSGILCHEYLTLNYLAVMRYLRAAKYEHKQIFIISHSNPKHSFEGLY
jgi:hypothetical protein